MAVQIFSNEPRMNMWWRYTNLGALGWAAFSIVLLWYRRFAYLPLKEKSTWMEVLAAFIVTSWVVGPALLFFVETQLIDSNDKQTKRHRMAEWKVGRGDAKAFWVAVASLVVGLYIEWNK
jgi:hypothetical protein